jgi:phenylacetate-coenzyme A ligase PaaK-like adenylate-forming protein
MEECAMGLDYNRKRLADFARALRETRGASERERWPRERLERWQDERLQRLAAHAREHSPLWRERLPAGRVRLSDLPVLTKAEMMERWDDVVTDRALRRDELLEYLEGLGGDELYRGEYRVMTTSGSSGRKGLFAYDRRAWRGLLTQFLRYSDWAGIRPRVPRVRIAAIGGGSATHMTRRIADTMAFGLHNICSLPVTLPVPKLVAALNDFQPDFLNAYPSMAVLLADEQAAGRLRVELNGMSTSSELLTPEARARIESAFGVRPTDFYATTEGLWGSDCGTRKHLFEDGCIVENVDADGVPVPPGTPGTRLLVTNLFNLAQPLFRIEISDAVTIAPEPCECGRTLAALEAVDGRADDVIEVAGAPVHPLAFAFVTADPAVREFQVVQRGERITLRVALHQPANGAADRLRTQFRERLGADVAVEQVDALDRPPSGKLQIVVAERA